MGTIKKSWADTESSVEDTIPMGTDHIEVNAAVMTALDATVLDGEYSGGGRARLSFFNYRSLTTTT
jgi:hypothetical protein